MAKSKYLDQPAKMDAIINEAPKTEEVSIDKMPLTNLSDYIRYNREARKLNKKLRICRYPIKPCPVELHPTEKVIFNRTDQPTNPLPVVKSDDMIDFKMTLVPGKTYDLPRYIVAHLAQKGTAVWKWFDNPDGSRETRVASKKPRFAIRTIYED